MAKIQIKNSFITSSADITISSSLVKFSGGISVKNITGSFSGSIPQLSSYFKQGGNSFGTTATLGTNDASALVFETNGSTRMTLDTNGNLGIGTTSPASKLSIVGSSATNFKSLILRNGDGTIGSTVSIDLETSAGTIGDEASMAARISGIRLGSGTTGGLVFSTTDGGSLGERVRILNNGAVGIGTTTPSLISGYIGLNVVNTGYTQIKLQSSVSSAGIEFKPSSGNSWELQSNNSNQWFVFDRTQELYRLLIDANGNVGIGTTSPKQKLHIVGEISLRNGDGYYWNAYYSSGFKYIGTGYAGYTIVDSTGAYTINTTNSSGTADAVASMVTRLYISSSGYVGIGTTSPTEKLDVRSGAIANGNGTIKTVLSYTTEGLVGTLSNHALLFYSNNTEKARITSGGNVLIGTTTSTANGGLLQIGQVPNTTASSIGFNNEDNAVISAKYNLVFQIDNTNSVAGRLYAWNKGGKGYSDGTNLMTLNASGSLGIGTTSPAAILDVVNTGRIQGILRTQSTPRTTFYDNAFAVSTDGGGATGFIYTSGTGGTFPLDFYGELILQSSPRTGYNNGISLVTGTTSPSVKLRISEVGNVGIGTTSPNELLEVTGTSPIIRVLAISGNSTLRLTDNGVRNWDLKVVDVSDYFEVGGTSATSLVVTGAGNVGIGTTSPAYKLDVAGSVYGSNYFSVLTAATYGPSDNSAAMQVFGSTGSGGLTNTIKFLTGGSERVRIDDNGNIGLGTSSPSAKLQIGTQTYATAPDATYFVAGNDSFSGPGPVGAISGYPTTANKNQVTASIFDVVSGWEAVNGSHAILRVSAYNVINSTPAFVVLCNGNVGIGTSSPAYKLEVASGTSGQQSLVNFRTADSTTANNAGIQIFATPSATATSREAVMLLDADGANASGGDYFLIKKRGNSGTTDFEQYSNASMRFGTNFISRATYDMTIANDGNVGIGTSSPPQKLSIYPGTTGGISLQDSGGTTRSYFFIDNTNPTYSTGIRTNNYYLDFDSSGGAQNAIRFYTGTSTIGTGTERMRISGSGTIQLNTLATYSSLTYEPSIIYTRAGQSGIGGIYFGNSYNSNNNVGMQLRVSNDGTQVQAVTINNQGIVGIGTTSPANSKLHIYADHPSGYSILKIQTITSIASGGVPSLAFFDSDGTRNTLVYAASDGTYLANEVNKPIIFSTNSTQKMTIASTGLVGIGTTVPASLLHVYSTSSEPTIRLTSTSGSAKTYGLVCNTAWAPGSFHIYDYTADATRIHISSGGNVGIGVGATSPATKLYVVSSGSPIARFDGSSVASSGATEIDVLGPQSNGDLNLGVGGSTFTDDTNNIQNKGYVTAAGGLSALNLRSDSGYVQITTGGITSANERMRITSDGKVGIGLTNPNTKLQVSGSATIGGYNAFYFGTGVTSLNITAPLYPVLAFYYGTNFAGTVGGYSDHIGLNTGVGGSKYISFEPGDSEKVRITATAALLVGNTSAPNPGAATTVSGFAINGSGNDAYISHKIDNGPCAYFRRDGTDGFVLAFYKANSSVGTISVTTTATAYNTTSDYRLKESVKPISDGLSRINTLKPSVYNWKSDGSNGEGFLAHELAEVVPLAVTGQKDAVNDDGSINPQSVDLSKIVPILVASIQELSAIVKQQQIEINDLKSKVNK